MSLRPQEYLDLLYQSAVDGTFPSVKKKRTGDFMCVYRGEGNKRCAVGVALPDEMYDKKFDNELCGGWTAITICDPKEGNIDPNSICEGATEIDLSEIQKAHDSCLRFEQVRWDPREFVRRINDVLLFAACQKRNHEEFPESLEEEPCLML